MLRVSLASRMAEIRRVNAAAAEFLSEEGVPDRTIHHVKLVIEELVSNVIRHAFDDDPAQRIEVDVRTEPRGVVVMVEDDGRPFNPTDAPIPALPSAGNDHRAGGLGIYLVRKLSRELSYSRENNRNRVRALIERAPR
jgi:anti-sigma regulatory factor (Ser/Thr protein kinase)